MSSAAPISPSSRVCALIPHHGCEAWLAQAIESLLDQSRPPERIIVIDDASPVPPVDIVAGYPEVTLLGVTDNGGPYRLVQAVVDATGFDTYLFQDADDWSAPDRLEVLLATGADSGAELIGSHEIRVLLEAGDVVSVRYPLDVNAALLESPVAYPLLHPTSIVTRSLLVRLGGFATGMRFSGDAELVRRACHVARVVNADHHGYFRRKRPGSLTLGSATALGTPVRRAVHAALANRANDNAELACRGQAPDLSPLRVVPIPALHHLVGPTLAADPAAYGARQRRRARRLPERRSSETTSPVFVLGAQRSGALALTWALGQHPALTPLDDSRWLARTCTDLEVRARDDATRPPDGFRTTLAEPLSRLAGRPGRRAVAGGAELLGAGPALAALFPDARFIHVARDPHHSAAAVAAGPTEGGSYLTPAASWSAWVEAARDGLALEAGLGAGRVLRIHHRELLVDPAAAAARCLTFLGLETADACVAALGDLREATTTGNDRGEPETGADGRAVDDARDLWAALSAPQSDGGGSTQARTDLAETFDRRQRNRRHGGTSQVERFRALVCGDTPVGATIAVVSRGDPRLVALPERTAWHLPQVAGGTFAGHHPGDSDEALTQLRLLQARGAGYLAIPAGDLWWLSHYDGLRAALDDEATLVAYRRESGIVFHLVAEPIDSRYPRVVAATTAPPSRRPTRLREPGRKGTRR